MAMIKAESAGKGCLKAPRKTVSKASAAKASAIAAPAARAGLEAQIQAEADRLKALKGTRRMGSIIVHGARDETLLAEAARTIAPGWGYGIERQGSRLRVVLQDRKGGPEVS